jgi:hypothetical protein
MVAPTVSFQGSFIRKLYHEGEPAMNLATILFILAQAPNSLLGIWSAETPHDPGNPDHFRFSKDGKVVVAREDKGRKILTSGTYKLVQGKLAMRFTACWVDGKPIDFKTAEASDKLVWKSPNEFRWSYGPRSEAVFTRMRDSQRITHILSLSQPAAAVPGGLLTGTYDVHLYDSSTGKPHVQDESKLPPGARKQGIIQGKRFAVVDMMSGFQGPIRVRGKAIEFLFEEGPAGKIAKVDVATVVPSKDKKTLTLMMKGKRIMVWTWRNAAPAIKLPY